MVDREKDAPKQATHRAYSIVRRDDQDEFWVNIGFVFPHADGSGFNLMLHAFPVDGKVVCREVSQPRDFEEMPT